MQSRQKPFDNTFGDQFETAQAGDFGRVEQIEPGCGRRSGGGGHAGVNVEPYLQ